MRDRLMRRATCVCVYMVFCVTAWTVCIAIFSSSSFSFLSLSLSLPLCAFVFLLILLYFSAIIFSAAVLLAKAIGPSNVCLCIACKCLYVSTEYFLFGRVWFLYLWGCWSFVFALVPVNRMYMYILHFI